METALVSGALAAILAALTGLTFLALRNPTGYHSLSDRILLWLSAGGALLGTWWLAMNVAELGFTLYVDADHREEACEYLNEWTFSGWWFPVLGVIGGYLILLQQLPGLLGEKNEKNKEG